jgi:membrane-associated protease RseP (regulator of RpoE activity)
LELHGEKVDSSWFKFFAPIRTLSTIKIKDATIGREAIHKISEVESLRYLELKFVRVGDDLIPALATLKQLQQLALIGTLVTIDGKTELETQLAGTDIDHRHGGFLGVRGGTHAIGCFVDDVVEDTAAAKAGIQRGDIIVYYNGKRIIDFDALRDGIAKHPPGATVNVRVIRADTLQAVHVFQKGDSLGAKFEKHEFGLKIEKLDGRDSFLVRRQFRPGDVIVQYHTLLAPTEKQLDDQLKQAETRLVKDRLSTQMMVTALRNPQIVELELKLGRFE